MKKGYTPKKNAAHESNRLERIEKHILSLTKRMDDAGFEEYLMYTTDTKRFVRRNFVAGVLRGVGGAIGFSVLGALFILLLRAIAGSSIPYIADFISQIMDVVEKS